MTGSAWVVSQPSVPTGLQTRQRERRIRNGIGAKAPRTPQRHHAGMLVVAIALALSPALAPAAEHVANGDFEELADDGVTPAEWVYIGADNGDGSLTTDVGAEGGKCAKITCTRADGRWGPGIGQVGVVEVTKGQWYELSFWARREGMGTGVFAALRDTTNWNDNQLWEKVYPSSQWRRFSLKFQARSDLSAEVSRLQFSFDTVGTVWLDRVSLTETERPRSPNIVDVGKTTNRVPNSSFEVGTYGWGTWGTTFLVGEIDDTTAQHGDCSFRLEVSPDTLPIHWNDFTYKLRGKPSHEPPPDVALVSAGYFPVTEGEAMCLSAFVKSDRPGAKVRFGIMEDTGALRANTLEVGKDWQRPVVAVTPQSDLAFVIIGLVPSDEPQPPTTLWIDAIQLEAGEKPTDYAPAVPVEVGLDTRHVGNVYHCGEEPLIRVTCYNATGEEQSVDLDLSLSGFFSETVVERRLSMRLAPLGKRERRLKAQDLRDIPRRRAPAREPGFYRLHARWDTDAGPQERHLRFAILQPLREAYEGQDTFLGQNHSFVTDRLMTLTRDAGTSWVRSWFVRWDDIEPEEGRFVFEEADAHLDRLERLGLNVEFCLGDPTSEWASTAPKDISETTGGEAESRRVWWMPRDMQAYEDYVAALMERYGDRVKHWEVFNEPTERKGGEGCNLNLKENYIRFLQAARRAAERTGEDVEIMGAGLGYFKEVADLNPILSAIDILSEHRYPGLAPAPDFLRSIRGPVEQMQEVGTVRPMWVTEYGIYADDDPDPTTINSRFLIHAGRDSEMLAASYTAKHQVLCLASGAEKVFFHIGNWPITLNREHGCGFHPFFEWGGIPRKMLVTENVLSWALPPGTEFVRAISDEPPLFAFEFARGKGTAAVVWCTHAEPVPAAVRDALNGDGISTYNIVGQKQRNLEELNEYPVYILAEDSAGANKVREALGEMRRSL